jgi:hypothetical protein
VIYFLYFFCFIPAFLPLLLQSFTLFLTFRQLKERREKAKASAKAKAPKEKGAAGKKVGYQQRGTGAKGR